MKSCLYKFMYTLHVYTFSTFQFRRATSPETDGQKSVFQGSGGDTNPGPDAAE